MKKFVLIVLAIIGIFVLSACGKSANLTDYVNVSFTGLDSKGVASYDVDEEQLFKDLFDYDPETDFPDEETLMEMEKIEDSYKVKLSKSEDLSNGDKITVTVTVDENVTKKIKGGEKEVTVEGLDEPKRLTTKDVEEHLVIDFLGASGQGVSRINNKFESPLNEIVFEIENDGTLKNDDDARIILAEGEEESLLNHGYILEDDFKPTFKVKGLDLIAEKATDIKNLKDIKRMINEEVQRSYKDIYPDSNIGTKYKIKEEAFMYRQFNNEEVDVSSYYDPHHDKHGFLIGIYSIEKYSGGDGELRDEFTVIIGYKNIVLDENDKANVAKLELFKDRKDSTYSLETIIQLYEGDGYSKFKE